MQQGRRFAAHHCFPLKKLLFLSLLSTLWSASFASASHVVVFHGTYQRTRPRDARVGPQPVEHCFLVIDVDPGRPASSEVLAGGVIYRGQANKKKQALFEFGLASRGLVQNDIVALILNRLDAYGSTIMGYGTNYTVTEFEHECVVLQGDLPRNPDGIVSKLRLPGVLTGTFTRFSTPDTTLPSSFAASIVTFNTAKAIVREQIEMSAAFRRDGLDVFASVARIQEKLAAQGFAK